MEHKKAVILAGAMVQNALRASSGGGDSINAHMRYLLPQVMEDPEEIIFVLASMVAACMHAMHDGESTPEEMWQQYIDGILETLENPGSG